MNITLKDGTIIEAQSGITPYEVAQRISDNLARMALIARVNDTLVDLNYPIKEDCSLELLTYRDNDGKTAYWHTASHILAQAVKNIYPAAQLAIGPAIKMGFYYDFDLPFSISMDDLATIEKEMQAIIKADFSIERFELTRRQALTQMRGYNEVYKVQLIDDLPKGTPISFYKQGDFIDLCKGPHLCSTGKIKHIKLIQLAGAYWRGNEKNKMLTRIYGVAFDKKSELTEFLEKIEEAKKRDHNKLGRELEIFMTEEKIGQGLPLLMPNGAKLFQILQRFVEDEEQRRGYLLTKTPYMAKSDLYKLSGHWEHYRDKMFVIGDDVLDDEVYALRPMTCPYQYMIYKNGLKSYRDLPIKYNETSTLFRNEASGEMHGLIRIRQFTLSEGHIICTPEQLEKEFKDCVDLCYYMLDTLGIREDMTFRFSKWDPKDKENYINEPKSWKRAEDLMKKILDNLGIEYVEAIGEAAFYGPKLDVQSKNVYGKEDTIITIQVDMFLAKNFDMVYIDDNGEKKHPYIIHRSSIGCYERTIAMLIEKYGGLFPLWLSPVQIKLLSLTDRTAQAAQDYTDKLNKMGFRAETDNRNEKIGYKIREAQLKKIPYMLIIGDKELQENSVSVRHRSGTALTMSFDEFVNMIKDENDNKLIK